MPLVAMTSFFAVALVCFLRELKFPEEEILNWGCRYGRAAMSPAEWKDRNTDAMRVRDVRIVLITVAFVFSFPLPSLSLICSFLAAFLVLLNCGRVSYARVKSDAAVPWDEENSDDPYDYGNMNENERYIYRLRRRIRIAKEVETEVQEAVRREFPEGTIQIERDLLKPGCKIDDTVILPFPAEKLRKTVETLEKIGNGD